MAGQDSASPIDFSDTIVAVATAPGRGALAIVRLSGPRAHAIARATLDRWPDEPRRGVVSRVLWPDEPRRVVVSPVRDAVGVELDEAVVTRYDGQASYTGEDAVELVTH